MAEFPTFSRASAAVSRAAGNPKAFGLALACVLLWAALGPFYAWSDSHSLFINTATTIVTFLMVFLVQNTQNRDGAALQAKLDSLIQAIDRADNRLIGIEKRAEAVEEIEEVRHDPEPAHLVEQPKPFSPFAWPWKL